MKKHLIFFLFAVASSSVFADDRLEVFKQEDVELHETDYGINYPGCGLIWRLDHSSFSSRIGITEMQAEQSSCKISIEQQTRLRNALLDRIIKDTKNINDLHTFSWGALPHDASNEYASRFTKAVSKSPLWDRKRGKKIGAAQKDFHFIPHLINDENIFSELTGVFAAHNLTLRAEDMEMVIVGHVDMPDAGITKADIVPIDCSILFLVTNKGRK